MGSIPLISLGVSGQCEQSELRFFKDNIGFLYDLCIIAVKYFDLYLILWISQKQTFL